jgi:NADPH-dependent curcumin reductase CurA
MENNKIVSREIHLKQRPTGFLNDDNFELVQVSIPQLSEGEFLVRNIWMSLDAHMRSYMSKGTKLMPAFKLNEPLNGECIGQIIESKNDKFKAGDCVLGNSGWREYWISDGSPDKNIIKIDPKIAPIRWFLGVLGISGLTAYVGLLKVGELGEGIDKVFVSAAAGGVGSVACQIAKIKGCYVVGSAGGKDKVEWLIKEAKVDYAFNYKTLGEDNISSELKKAFPNGIDLYFDNVGGKHLEAAIHNMDLFGRIVLCGSTSTYNTVTDNTSSAIGPLTLSLAISHRLRLQGFIYTDHYNMLDQFRYDMSKWIAEGKIKWNETIYEGLENAPKAFMGLFKGENLGRALVKIGPDSENS